MGCLAAAYRSTPHESTGLTPNLVFLGREVRIPAEIIHCARIPSVGSSISSYGEYVMKLRERMEKAHDITRKHLLKSSQKQKERYDLKINLNEYKPGDYV